MSRPAPGGGPDRDEALRTVVFDCLSRGWSPEQTVNRLARQAGQPVISHESVYRFLYAQIRRTNDGSWRRCLPRAKFKWGWRGRKGGSPALFIRDRVAIDQQPKTARHRRSPGHWEADLMPFATYGQAVLAAHEHHSRFLFLAKQPNEAAQPAANQLRRWLEPLPGKLHQTIPFDTAPSSPSITNSKPNSASNPSFATPIASGRKAASKNAIGRMRRALPRKTNFATLDAHCLDDCVADYNNTPRKCLDFRTPAEAFLS
jgi:IS30 family transposase